MESDPASRDIAIDIEAQVQDIRSACEEADRAYGAFRAAILASPPVPRNVVPVEWIPISDQ